MDTAPKIIRLPSHAESVGPVTIFDRQGAVVGIVSAEEFRRRHPAAIDARGIRPALRRRRQPSAPVSAS